MKYLSVVFVCLFLSSHSFAKSGDFGVEGDVSTVGFFASQAGDCDGCYGKTRLISCEAGRTAWR
jgi:hypothetical protein